MEDKLKQGEVPFAETQKIFLNINISESGDREI